MVDYEVYGLRIRSDGEIPGFVACRTEHRHVDVTVTFDLKSGRHRDVCARWHAHPRLIDQRPTDAGVATVRLEESDDNLWVAVTYSDGARFLIAADGSAIYVLPADGMDRDSVSTYLVNPVLALCLRFQGLTSLHACAVSIGGRSVVFVGPSGAGKSTLAYALDRLGHAVLTDDVTVLRDSPHVVSAGYPRIRLWPWTVDGLLGDPEALPRVSSDWAKRSAPINLFRRGSVPLGAVCLLDGFDDDISVEIVAPALAVMALMENVYLNYLLDDLARRTDFLQLCGVVDSVPVLRVQRPCDLSALDNATAALVGAIQAATKEPGAGGTSPKAMQEGTTSIQSV